MLPKYNKESSYERKITTSDNLYTQQPESPDAVFREKMKGQIEQLNISLEKERFFNKLLDQEVKDLKGISSGKSPLKMSGYWFVQKGVSKPVFYALLVVSLVMAAYIAATIFLRS